MPDARHVTGRSDSGSGASPNFLRVLRRRWMVALLALILVPAAAVVASKAQSKVYESTAVLLFRDPGFDRTLFGSQVTGGQQDPTREAATNVGLVSLPTIAARTAVQLGGGLTTKSVLNAVDVQMAGDSNLVSVTARGASPVAAQRVANTMATQYIAFRREADRNQIRDAQRTIDARLRSQTSASDPTTRADLNRGRDQLEVLASLQTGNAELVQPARRPIDPVSPKVRHSAMLGLLGGILLGIVAALLAERLDRRVRDVGEFEDALGLPVLATVPQSRSLADGPRSLQQLDLPAAEAFRMLRARLMYFNVERQRHRIVVTSAGQDDGKTTVAWYLAAAAAESGLNVMVLEADLRRPTIAELKGVPAQPGLSEYLTRSASLDDVVGTVVVRNPPLGDDRATVDVITAGLVPPNPIELLESAQMADLLAVLGERYDLVVVDTPPAVIVSDALPLMRQADGVVAVTRVGVTQRVPLHQLARQFRELRAPALGTVVNGAPPNQGAAYGYGYRTRQESHDRREEARV